MEEKFIPGPWKFVERDDINESYIKTTIQPAHGGDIVCEPPIAWDRSMDMWHANAKLIAAAPDMYGIIKHIVTYELAPNDILRQLKAIIKNVNE